MSEPLTLRLMTRDEVEWLFDSAVEEGWDPGLHDADIHWAVDPEAFVAAEVGGELIGGGAIVRYDRGFGSLGHVTVRPEHREPSLEARLWRACLQLLRGRLDADATVGLDGLSRLRERYVGAGFRFSHRTIRYETVGAAPEAAAPTVVPAAEVPLERLAAYDRRCFPAARDRFLQSWLDTPDSLALALADAETVRGYGIIRRGRTGARVAPLLADDATVAEALLDALLAFAPDEPVLLDMPEPNAWAMSLARRRRMHQVSSRGRLYLGPAPRVAEARIFGDTTFELG